MSIPSPLLPCEQRWEQFVGRQYPQYDGAVLLPLLITFENSHIFSWWFLLALDRRGLFALFLGVGFEVVCQGKTN